MNSLTPGERLTTCSHCDKLKPESAFSPRKDQPGKVTSWCLDCMRGRQNARRQAQRAAKPIQPKPTVKLCLGSCGLTLPVEQFGWKDQKANRRREKCPACHNTDTRQYKSENREQLRARGRVYYADNRDERREAARLARIADPARFRAVAKKTKLKNKDRVRTDTQRRRDSLRGRGGKITAAELRALFARYGWRCVRCGHAAPLAFDHIDPHGPGNLANGQPLCTPCNSWKLTKVDESLDFRPNSPYDTRSDLPVGTVDIAMADAPVPEWVHHPRREIAAERTEKLCLGPLHTPDGLMLPIESFPIRSQKSGKPFRTTVCRDCKNVLQRQARADKASLSA